MISLRWRLSTSILLNTLNSQLYHEALSVFLNKIQFTSCALLQVCATRSRFTWRWTSVQLLTGQRRSIIQLLPHLRRSLTWRIWMLDSQTCHRAKERCGFLRENLKLAFCIRLLSAAESYFNIKKLVIQWQFDAWLMQFPGLCSLYQGLWLVHP